MGRASLAPSPLSLCRAQQTPRAVAAPWDQAAAPGETAPSWGYQSLGSETLRPGACRSYNSSIFSGAGRQEGDCSQGRGRHPAGWDFNLF